MSSDWLSSLGNSDAPNVLVCFPPGGVNARVAFSGWEGLLPSFEVVLVQLPGRGHRMLETSVDDPLDIANNVATALYLDPSYRQRPMCFYGHSCGAWFAAFTAAILQLRGGIPVSTLIVAASAGPSPSSSAPSDEVHHLKSLSPSSFVRAFSSTLDFPPSLVDQLGSAEHTGRNVFPSGASAALLDVAVAAVEATRSDFVAACLAKSSFGGIPLRVSRGCRKEEEGGVVDAEVGGGGDCRSFRLSPATFVVAVGGVGDSTVPPSTLSLWAAVAADDVAATSVVREGGASAAAAVADIGGVFAAALVAGEHFFNSVRGSSLPGCREGCDSLTTLLPQVLEAGVRRSRRVAAAAAAAHAFYESKWLERVGGGTSDGLVNGGVSAPQSLPFMMKSVECGEAYDLESVGGLLDVSFDAVRLCGLGSMPAVVDCGCEGAVVGQSQGVVRGSAVAPRYAVSYSVLDVVSGQLARWLVDVAAASRSVSTARRVDSSPSLKGDRSERMHPDDVVGRCVGILMPRCAEYVVALCGAARAGIAYVAVEVSYPPPFAAEVVTQSQCCVVLSVTAMADHVSKMPTAFQERVVFLDVLCGGVEGAASAYPPWKAAQQAHRAQLAQQVQVSVAESRPWRYVHSTAAKEGGLDQYRGGRLASGEVDGGGGVGPTTPYFVLFTGGTTGKPKGVVMPQRGAAWSFRDRLRWHPYAPHRWSGGTTPNGGAAPSLTALSGQDGAAKALSRRDSAEAIHTPPSRRSPAAREGGDVSLSPAAWLKASVRTTVWPSQPSTPHPLPRSPSAPSSGNTVGGRTCSRSPSSLPPVSSVPIAGAFVASNVFFVWECLRPLMGGACAVVQPQSTLVSPVDAVEWFSATHAFVSAQFGAPCETTCAAEVGPSGPFEETFSVVQHLARANSSHPAVDRTVPACTRGTFVVSEVLLTPSAAAALTTLPPPLPLHLHRLWLCGEVVSHALLGRLSKAVPSTQVLNLYSVSECHDVSTCALTHSRRLPVATLFNSQATFPPPIALGGASAAASCGVLNDGVCVLVVQRSDPTVVHPIAAVADTGGWAAFVQPMGVIGEVLVAGPTVAAGYLERPLVNAVRFFEGAGIGTAGLLNVAEEVGVLRGVEKVTRCGGYDEYKVWYRTGDVGRVLPTGELEICGRADGVCKLRGYTVDLTTLESTVAAEGGVVKAVAEILTLKGAEGMEDKALVCVVEREEDAAQSTPLAAAPAGVVGGLRTAIKASLPFYYVPSVWMVGAIPTHKASDKANRGVVKQMMIDFLERGGGAFQQPRDALPSSDSLSLSTTVTTHGGKGGSVGAAGEGDAKLFDVDAVMVVILALVDTVGLDALGGAVDSATLACIEVVRGLRPFGGGASAIATVGSEALAAIRECVSAFSGESMFDLGLHSLLLAPFAEKLNGRIDRVCEAACVDRGGVRSIKAVDVFSNPTPASVGVLVGSGGILREAMLKAGEWRGESVTDQVKGTSVEGEMVNDTVKRPTVPSPSPPIGPEEGDEMVIVGCGVAGPGGACDVSAVWDALLSHQPCLKRLSPGEVARRGGPPAVENGSGAVKVGGTEVPWVPVVGEVGTERMCGFDTGLFGMSDSDAAACDPQQRLLCEVVFEALSTCGLCPFGSLGRGEDACDGGDAVGREVGLFGATLLSTFGLRVAQAAPPTLYTSTDPLADSAFETSVDKDYAPLRVAFSLDLHGPAAAVQTSCSSGLAVVDAALSAVLRGHCRVAVAAASSVRWPPPAGHAAHPALMLSTDTRRGVVAPFSDEACGTTFSDAAAAVVIMRASTAEALGVTPLATLLAVGANSDGLASGQRTSFLAPSEAGQRAVVTSAWKEAGAALRRSRRRTSGEECKLVPRCVEAHGTGTLLGDSVELRSLAAGLSAVGGGAGTLVTSCKGVLGHTNIAAGIVGFVKGTLTVATGRVPTLPYPGSEGMSDGMLVPHGSDPRCKCGAGSDGEHPSPASSWSLRGCRFCGGDTFESDAVDGVGVSAFGVGAANFHAVLCAPPPRTRGTLLAPGSWLSDGGSDLPSCPLPPLVFGGASEECIAADMRKVGEWLEGLAAGVEILGSCFGSASEAVPDSVTRGALEHALGVPVAHSNDCAGSCQPADIDVQSLSSTSQLTLIAAHHLITVCREAMSSLGAVSHTMAALVGVWCAVSCVAATVGLSRPTVRPPRRPGAKCSNWVRVVVPTQGVSAVAADVEARHLFSEVFTRSVVASLRTLKSILAAAVCTATPTVGVVLPPTAIVSHMPPPPAFVGRSRWVALFAGTGPSCAGALVAAPPAVRRRARECLLEASTAFEAVADVNMRSAVAVELAAAIGVEVSVLDGLRGVWPDPFGGAVEKFLWDTGAQQPPLAVQQVAQLVLQVAVVRSVSAIAGLPSVVSGHSYGSAAAAVAACQLPLCTAVLALVVRGGALDIFVEHSKSVRTDGLAIPSVLLAVRASVDAVERLIASADVDLSTRPTVVAVNSVNDTVIACTSEVAAVVEGLLSGDGEGAALAYRRVPSHHPFHSPAIGPLMSRFGAALYAAANASPSAAEALSVFSDLAIEGRRSSLVVRTHVPPAQSAAAHAATAALAVRRSSTSPLYVCSTTAEWFGDTSPYGVAPPLCTVAGWVAMSVQPVAWAAALSTVASISDAVAVRGSLSDVCTTRSTGLVAVDVGPGRVLATLCRRNAAAGGALSPSVELLPASLDSVATCGAFESVCAALARDGVGAVSASVEGATSSLEDSVRLLRRLLLPFCPPPTYHRVPLALPHTRISFGTPREAISVTPLPLCSDAAPSSSRSVASALRGTPRSGTSPSAGRSVVLADVASSKLTVSAARLEPATPIDILVSPVASSVAKLRCVIVIPPVAVDRHLSAVASSFAQRLEATGWYTPTLCTALSAPCGGDDCERSTLPSAATALRGADVVMHLGGLVGSPHIRPPSRGKPEHFACSCLGWTNASASAQCAACGGIPLDVCLEYGAVDVGRTVTSASLLAGAAGGASLVFLALVCGTVPSVSQCIPHSGTCTPTGAAVVPILTAASNERPGALLPMAVDCCGVCDPIGQQCDSESVAISAVGPMLAAIAHSTLVKLFLCGAKPSLASGSTSSSSSLGREGCHDRVLYACNGGAAQQAPPLGSEWSVAEHAASVSRSGTAAPTNVVSPPPSTVPLHSAVSSGIASEFRTSPSSPTAPPVSPEAQGAPSDVVGCPFVTGGSLGEPLLCHVVWQDVAHATASSSGAADPSSLSTPARGVELFAVSVASKGSKVLPPVDELTRCLSRHRSMLGCDAAVGAAVKRVVPSVVVKGADAATPPSRPAAQHPAVADAAVLIIGLDSRIGAATAVALLMHDTRVAVIGTVRAGNLARLRALRALALERGRSSLFVVIPQVDVLSEGGCEEAVRFASATASSLLSDGYSGPALSGVFYLPCTAAMLFVEDAVAGAGSSNSAVALRSELSTKVVGLMTLLGSCHRADDISVRRVVVPSSLASIVPGPEMGPYAAACAVSEAVALRFSACEGRTVPRTEICTVQFDDWLYSDYSTQQPTLYHAKDAAAVSGSSAVQRRGLYAEEAAQLCAALLLESSDSVSVGSAQSACSFARPLALSDGTLLHRIAQWTQQWAVLQRPRVDGQLTDGVTSAAGDTRRHEGSAAVDAETQLAQCIATAWRQALTLHIDVSTNVFEAGADSLAAAMLVPVTAAVITQFTFNGTSGGLAVPKTIRVCRVLAPVSFAQSLTVIVSVRVLHRLCTSGHPFFSCSSYASTERSS